MAYHRDDMANYLWNDLVGPGGQYHRSPSHGYPVEIESGSPPRQERTQSQPSRRQIEIESGPSSPVAPPARQQSGPSRTRQSDIENPPPPTAAKKPNPLRRPIVLVGFSALFIVIVFAAFFAILRPKSPSFRLDAVTVYYFTATGAALSYRLDAEISSHNPNHLVGIHYRQLEAFAVLGQQRITEPAVPLSPAEFYQGHKDSIAWPPAAISGDGLQLSAQEQENLTAELNSAVTVKLEIRLKGRLKWKVGSWASAWWHLHVACPANLRFTDPVTGVPLGNGLRFPLGETCLVDVD